MNKWKGRRWAVNTSVAGTVFIAAGAFWLSFTSLADLARRAGIGEGQAWVWPLIVDGVIVVSTVAVVALDGERAAWYPWTLLIGGAAVSVTANGMHAIVTADAGVPPALAAAVAAVPPVVLLAATHLTVVLIRSTAEAATRNVEADELHLDALTNDQPPSVPGSSTPTRELPAVSEPVGELLDESDGEDRRARAARLRADGWSNKKIAHELRVHPSTVGRWFADVHHPDESEPESPELVMEGAAS